VEGLALGGDRREQRPAHEREVGVDEAGVDAGDVPPDEDLPEAQRGDDGRETGEAGSRASRGATGSSAVVARTTR
jgi:hypothetical protein